MIFRSNRRRSLTLHRSPRALEGVCGRAACCGIRSSFPRLLCCLESISTDEGGYYSLDHLSASNARRCNGGTLNAGLRVVVYVVVVVVVVMVERLHVLA